MILRLMSDDRKPVMKQLAMFQCERNQHGKWGFSARLIVGPGAGYRGGFTAYLAIRSGSNLWRHMHRGERRKLIELGITRNANVVPYAATY